MRKKENKFEKYLCSIIDYEIAKLTILREQHFTFEEPEFILVELIELLDYGFLYSALISCGVLFESYIFQLVAIVLANDPDKINCINKDFPDFKNITLEVIKKENNIKGSDDLMSHFLCEPVNINEKVSSPDKMSPFDFEVLKCISKPKQENKFARFTSQHSIKFLSKVKVIKNGDEKKFFESISSIRNIVIHGRINLSKEMALFPFKESLSIFLGKIKSSAEQFGHNVDFYENDFGAGMEIFQEFEALFFITKYIKAIEVIGRIIHRQK